MEKQAYYTLDVSTAGETVRQTITPPATWTQVRGFAIQSDREDLTFYRGTCQVDINGGNWVEEETATRLFMQSTNLSGWQRHWPFGDMTLVPGLMELTYTDHPHPKGVFEPYTVYFLFLVDENI